MSDEKKPTYAASAPGGDAAARGSDAGCGGVRAEAARTARCEEMHRRMGSRPLVGFPMRKAIAAEARELRTAGLSGEALAAEVTRRLDLDGWLSAGSIRERCEVAP